MNTSEIRRALQNHPITKAAFLGVFASNQLPQRIEKKPSCLVANTDVDSGPGQHWIAIYFDEDGQVADYFDSYGLPPMLQSFKMLLQPPNASHVNVNNTQLQGFMSSVCGQYCIYFLLHRCQGFPMRKIVKLPFNNNHFINDAFVTEYVNRFFDLSTVTFEDQVVLNQICSAFGLSSKM